MSHRHRIALIHATRVAIDPIEAAAGAIWPDAETVTILEEGLSADRAKTDALSPDLSDRIMGLAKYADGMGADGVLFTCSAFGGAIEDAAAALSIPVLKPNEAMFEAALAHGPRVVLVYTFAPAAPGMMDEFNALAKKHGREARIGSIYCGGALDALRAGDAGRHDQLIAETVQGITDADVILLAQFSMASAAPLARQGTKTPILTSPESAITKIKHIIVTSDIGDTECC